MKQARRGIVALAFTQALASSMPVSAPNWPVADDWREQCAYSVGVQAYIYTSR